MMIISPYLPVVRQLYFFPLLPNKIDCREWFSLCVDSWIFLTNVLWSFYGLELWALWDYKKHYGSRMNIVLD